MYWYSYWDISFQIIGVDSCLVMLFKPFHFVYLLCLFIFCNLVFTHFSEIFSSEHLIFPYAIHPFDICSLYPETWELIKKTYYLSFVFSYTIIHFLFYFKVKSRCAQIFCNKNMGEILKNRLKRANNGSFLVIWCIN